MSEENVEALREMFEAVNRRDVPGILRFMDPEVRFEPQIAALEGSYVGGHDGVRRFFADNAEDFDTFEVHCPDMRHLGDQVLAFGRARGLAKVSGIETEAQLAIVVMFRDGLITHFKHYRDKEEALEAAGLSE
jgi:ketosteroid isomerase-like protein